MSNRFDNVTGIEELIGQTVGAASMCWENVEAAGVFDDVEARAVTGEALERLSQLLGDDTITENVSLRTELAARDADIIGQQTIIAILQKKLREAEDEASVKRAAARQPEDIQIANGLMTTVIPTVIVDETSPQ